MIYDFGIFDLEFRQEIQEKQFFSIQSRVIKIKFFMSADDMRIRLFIMGIISRWIRELLENLYLLKMHILSNILD